MELSSSILIGLVVGNIDRLTDEGIDDYPLYSDDPSIIFARLNTMDNQPFPNRLSDLFDQKQENGFHPLTSNIHT